MNTPTQIICAQSCTFVDGRKSWSIFGRRNALLALSIINEHDVSCSVHAVARKQHLPKRRPMNWVNFDSFRCLATSVFDATGTIQLKKLDPTLLCCHFQSKNLKKIQIARLEKIRINLRSLMFVIYYE